MTSTTTAPEKTTTEVKVPEYRKKIEKYYFEMFSKKGETACRNGVKKIFKKVEGKRKLTQESIQAFYEKVMNDIEKTHSEVWDTEPRDHIIDLTNMSLKENGYNFRVY